MKKLTTQDFIKRSLEIHKSEVGEPLYDYKYIQYKGSKDKVIIFCKKKNHGKFSQSPNQHLRGEGCPSCGGRLKLSNQEFIDKSKKIHKNKYDYSKVIYVKIQDKVIINCFKNDHGEFLQKPQHHLNGHGCPKCAGIKKITQAEFIERAIKKHQNENGKQKYDYSKTLYKNAHTKVIITCSKDSHGDFLQKAYDHLRENGCPKCHYSKGEEIISKFLIKNNIEYIQNKRFFDCKFKNPLPFDFYLPKFNLCIEYDGRQHFFPVKKFGGNKGLKQVIIKDNIKTNFCLKNGINILRIPYTEFKKIDKILINQLL